MRPDIHSDRIPDPAPAEPGGGRLSRDAQERADKLAAGLRKKFTLTD